MVIKRHKPEEIVTKLRHVDVLCGQRTPRIDAIRQVQIKEQTFFRWRKQYGGMGTDQLMDLKRLPKENDRLRPSTDREPRCHLRLRQSEAGAGEFRRVPKPSILVSVIDLVTSAPQIVDGGGEHQEHDERYVLERSPFAQKPTQRDVADLVRETRDDLRRFATPRLKEHFLVRRETESGGKVRKLVYPVSDLRAVHERLKFHLNKSSSPVT